MKFLYLLFAGLVSAPLWAEPTEIDVRVLAKDAKFVGSGMGGMAVRIRSVQTSEILSEGVIQGGTGDTNRIMKKTWKRGKPLTTEGTAHYHASIDIDQPTLVEVSVRGPLGYPHASQVMSLTHWLIPGKHVTGGDALRLELPGFVVTADVSPSELSASSGEAITINARVTMMCGCPITPNGLWDANDYEIAAWVYRDGERIAEAPLAYAGEASEFSTQWQPQAPGYYEILVYGFDETNGNTGVDQAGVLVQR